MELKGISREQFVRLKKGDPTVIEELYEVYKPLIWRAFRGHPKGLSSDEWEQEMGMLFVKASNNIKEKDFAAFTTYLQTAAWRTMQKLRARHEKEALEYGAPTAFHENTMEYGTENSIQSKQSDFEEVMACTEIYQGLDPLHQKIMVLSLAGYNSVEIAKITSNQAANVRAILGKIRVQMRWY
ncbi:MAG: hypothetical protein LBT37_00615 [Lactobacillaceae bacterium]|jgi:DNA-directed RNA polymerase specialized sigma24 family protein|nr:hypothetical protein [Lactobacillaceae bacterium]